MVFEEIQLKKKITYLLSGEMFCHVVYFTNKAHFHHLHVDQTWSYVDYNWKMWATFFNV